MGKLKSWRHNLRGMGPSIGALEKKGSSCPKSPFVALPGPRRALSVTQMIFSSAEDFVCF